MKIELKNVTAGYEKDQKVLKGIDILFEEGGIWGVMGPNGSGKTTLLKVLSGTLPYQGSILLGKDELKSVSRKHLATLISMMPQFSQAYFSYTVYDTVLLGRYSKRSSRLSDILKEGSSEDHKAVEEALRLTGLWDIRDSDLQCLSGGQLQRTMLARTIAQDTPVILLDEPTNHLDLKFHHELLSYLKDFSSSTAKIDGVTHRNTVITVFHDIGTASLIADNIILMKDGEIVQKGPASSVTGQILNSVYDTNVVAYYDELSRKILTKNI